MLHIILQPCLGYLNSASHTAVSIPVCYSTSHPWHGRGHRAPKRSKAHRAMEIAMCSGFLFSKLCVVVWVPLRIIYSFPTGLTRYQYSTLVTDWVLLQLPWKNHFLAKPPHHVSTCEDKWCRRRRPSTRTHSTGHSFTRSLHSPEARSHLTMVMAAPQWYLDEWFCNCWRPQVVPTPFLRRIWSTANVRYMYQGPQS